MVRSMLFVLALGAVGACAVDPERDTASYSAAYAYGKGSGSAPKSCGELTEKTKCSTGTCEDDDVCAWSGGNDGTGNGGCKCY
jgi:hypothetical protein